MLLLLEGKRTALSRRVGLNLPNLLVQPGSDFGALHLRLLAKLGFLTFLLRGQVSKLLLLLGGQRPALRCCIRLNLADLSVKLCRNFNTLHARLIPRIGVELRRCVGCVGVELPSVGKGVGVLLGNGQRSAIGRIQPCRDAHGAIQKAPACALLLCRCRGLVNQRAPFRRELIDLAGNRACLIRLPLCCGGLRWSERGRCRRGLGCCKHAAGC